MRPSASVLPCSEPVSPPRRVRRGVAALVAATTAVLALAACAAEAAKPGVGGSAASSPAASAGASGEALPPAEGTTHYPLTLKTAWGESTLPARPQRIAVVQASGTDVELLAAMKVTPVLASSVVMERSLWAKQAIPGQVEKVFEADSSSAMPFEQIAAVKPDLIVTTDDDLKDSYAKLSKIAPVLGASQADTVDLSWRQRIVQLGQALDLAKAAEDAIKTHDDGLARIREQYPQFAGKTSTYAVQYSAEYGMRYDSMPGSDTEKLFTSLGFAPNPLGAKLPKSGDVSAENLLLLDADALVISDVTGGTLKQVLTSKPLYQKIPAVKDKRVVILGSENDGKAYSYDGQTHDGNLPWALANPGPLADVWAAEQFGPILATIVH